LGIKLKISAFCFIATFTSTLSKAQGLILPSNSYIINNGYLSFGKNFTNNGHFTNNGTIIFSGGTQEVNGSVPISFNDAIVLTGSTTTINSSGHTVNNSILCNGTLDANGNITLLSTATKSAFINGTGTGNVIGNITMQRYITSGFGYKYISSPFQSATVAELSDDMDLNESFCTFYRYQEDTASTGWIKYNNTSNVLTPLRGYAANFGTSTSAKTINMTGVVSNGNISLSGMYNHNKTYTLGFHLIGNPYPSAIDWNLSGGWTRTNIDDAVYYFRNGSSNRYLGAYSTYINGVSSDGVASNIIAAMQGFFVHVSNGVYPVAATLSINNNARVTNTNTSFLKSTIKEGRTIVKISVKATGEEIEDNAIIYFDQDATPIFESNMDAIKLFNTDERIPNLFTLLQNGERLSINALPILNDTTVIVPLGLKIERSNQISFHSEILNQLPFGQKAYFVDADMGTIFDVPSQNNSSVILQAGEYYNRFFIVFSKEDISKQPLTHKVFNAYYAGNKIFVYLNFLTGDKGDIVITDIMGRKVSQYTISGYGAHELPAPPTDGIYLLNYYSDKGHFSNKVFTGGDR
jgi:hypothetical protein